MEGARVLVAQQERHLGDGQPAVAQEGQRQVVAELGEHRAKRRPLFAQPSLERPGAHPEHTPHAIQVGDPGAQLGPRQLAHLVVEGVRVPEGREELRSKVVKQGLHALGWIEGQNLASEYRWAAGQVDRLPALAEELVRLQG